MMWRIDKMEQVPTSILSAERCHLGEGPTYDAATDTAWWFDILEGRLFEAHLGNGQIRSHLLGRMASALGRIDAKRQLIAAEDGLYIRSVANGSMTLYRPLESDNRFTRSNDARVHPSGTFWIGTMGRKAEAGAGAIYALYRGEISQLFPASAFRTRSASRPTERSAISPTRLRMCCIASCSTRRLGCPAARPKSYCSTAASVASTARLSTPTADLECALGRRLCRCLQSARAASALFARTRAPSELPGFRWIRSVAFAGHVGLAGHG